MSTNHALAPVPTATDKGTLPGDADLDNTSLFQHVRQRANALLKHDAQLKLSQSLPSEREAMLHECRYVIEYLAKACQLFADRPALGVRAVRRSEDPPGPSFEVLPYFNTITYKQLWQRITNLATGLYEGGWVGLGNFVGIIGFTGVDYVVAQYACLYLGAVVVPLQTMISMEELDRIAGETGLTTLIVSAEQCDGIIPFLRKNKRVHHLVVMPTPADDGAAAMQSLSFGHESDIRCRMVNTLQAIERDGGKRPMVPYTLPDEGEESLQMLLYTSGSTGSPKGAKLTERMLGGYWRKAITEIRGSLPDEPEPLPQVDIGMSFMPQNHVVGQLNILESLARGGLLHFTLMSDMSSLFEDIRLANPTSLILVPRIAEMVYQFYQNELALRTKGKSDCPKHEICAMLEREMGQTFLGNRLFFIRTGTAPIAGEVLAFLKRTFQVPVYSMYGTTEAGYVLFENQITASVVTDFKLVDVPELGYRVSDNPYPRGELRLKAVCGTPGYFHNVEATRKLIDDDGYLCTGDIFEQHDPDHFSWIDRCNNIVKLAQGEFVSLWHLESLYAGESPFISQIYLHADSLYAYPLAVIVPDREILESQLGRLPDDAELRRLLVSELQQVAHKHQLQPYEVPRSFLIEHQRFTRENGLLTDSAKPARQRLKDVYGSQLERLYNSLDDARRDKSAQLRAESSLSLVQKVKDALSATLGVVDEFTLSESHSFLDLGGDSLAAVEFSALLAGLTGVTVPLGLIFNSSGNLVDDIVQFVTTEAKVQVRPSFKSVHGSNGGPLLAQQLTLEAFFEKQELAAATQAGSAVSRERQPSQVLLTGSNGFLGSMLTLELLEQLPPNGKLYCLVRARSIEDGLERLRAGLANDISRDQFEQHIEQGRLVVVTGDLMLPKFGLDEQVWLRLAEEVDAIVHNGAMVNHSFSYEQMFEPNVLGTMEVARLAISVRHKAIHFVSSLAVSYALPPRPPIREAEDSLTLCKKWPTDAGYASGYGASKWAGEILLHQLSERFNIPVNIYRCGMLLAHSTRAGKINADDVLSRLLISLNITGIAPRSFYAHSNASGRFSGLPVNLVARVLAALTLKPHQGYMLYHVVNHYDEGVSLDHIVDWMIKRGSVIERIDDYEQWYQEFTRQLSMLDAATRSRSAYPTLSLWQEPAAPEDYIRFDISRFASTVKELSAEIDIAAEIPALTQEFILKCLDDLDIISESHMK